MNSLPFDLREIRDFLHRSAETGKQVQPAAALFWLLVIHRHLVKESVDRCTQGCEGRHGAFEVLGKLFSTAQRHLGRDHFLQIGVVNFGQRIFLASLGDFTFDALPIFLFEDIGGALVAS